LSYLDLADNRNPRRRSHRSGKQLKGWRREKKLNLIRTVNPEFKDLAQTWGWKMITVHEKMDP
jgi:predicted GIY-YIG superfamily endonuclease